VTLHVWGVSPRGVPRAVARVARDRRLVCRHAGLRFAKLLGTGRGRSFSLRDADPLHWALLATWDSVPAATGFERSRTVTGWDRIAHERLRVTLRPLASRGEWSGRRPFGDPPPERYAGPVAVITRARLHPLRTGTFRRAVPPVAAALRAAPGLRFALGIGEAPVGLQGTFSLWDSPAALSEFAHRGPAHAAVIRRTAEVGWYTEELFARFAVVDVDGSYGGRAV